MIEAGDADDPQSYEDINKVTFDASSLGHQAIQCAPPPAGPRAKLSLVRISS